MTKIKEITTYLESIAPIAYQENYDNSGLLVGDPNAEVTNILITLDVTEAVVQEAIDTGANLIIAHHPVIFKGLQKLTGDNYVERVVLQAIKNDIGIYGIHTNLDNIKTGVNKKIADKIGLKNTSILSPKQQHLLKLVFFVPFENTEDVLHAVNQAGAGQVGNYKNCSFRVAGTGTFEPDAQANPHIGSTGIREEVEEHRVEVILPAYLKSKVLKALLQAHPYEEVAYYITVLENQNQEVGSGMIGELDEPMEEMAFLKALKEKMNLQALKHTALRGKKVSRVAVCGGSGSFLLTKAIQRQADVFISADFKYHEYFNTEGNIVIADIGHYESEVFTKELIYEFLNKKFTNIALNLSKKVTNPISYL